MTPSEIRLIKSYMACKDMLDRFPGQRGIQDDGKRLLNEILQEINQCVGSLQMKQALGLIG